MGDLKTLLARTIPFLRDAGITYEDDGSNEPLELAREIEAAITTNTTEGYLNDAMIRRVAIAINAAWTGRETFPRNAWKWLGSGERRHRDYVARAALTAAFNPESRAILQLMESNDD